MARMTAEEFVEIHGPTVEEILLEDYTLEKCRALGEEVANGTSASHVLNDLRSGRKRLAEQARQAEEAQQAAK